MSQKEDVAAIEVDDAVAAMEAAKSIIGEHDTVESQTIEALLAIAINKNQKSHSRVAAVYCLGLVDSARFSASGLRCILADIAESVELRDHVAEALGNMRDAEAIPLLWQAAKDPAMEVRDSAYFALSELGALSE